MLKKMKHKSFSCKVIVRNRLLLITRLRGVSHDTNHFRNRNRMFENIEHLPRRFESTSLLTDALPQLGDANKSTAVCSTTMSEKTNSYFSN